MSASQTQKYFGVINYEATRAPAFDNIPSLLPNGRFVILVAHVPVRSVTRVIFGWSFLTQEAFPQKAAPVYGSICYE